MPTAFTRILLSLLLLLPLAAHAGDAQDFVTANPAKQASLLERWSAAPDAARLPLLEALQQGRVAADSTKTAFIEVSGAYQPAEGEAVPTETPRKLRLNNRLRGLIDNVQASQQLLAADPKVRLAAAQTLQKSAQPAQLKFLDQRVAAETDEELQKRFVAEQWQQLAPHVAQQRAEPPRPPSRGRGQPALRRLQRAAVAPPAARAARAASTAESASPE